MTTLVQKVVTLAHALGAARVPHAFGGALALAYWTQDPRGTRDIDVNAFVPSAEPERVLSALPAGVAVPPGTADVLRGSGQVRLWWYDTPVDLFLNYAPLHAQAAQHVRHVPFAGGEIAVLGPVELVLFKALFDRPKDWVDIAAVVEAGSLADPSQVRDGLVRLLGEQDPRVARWTALTT